MAKYQWKYLHIKLEVLRYSQLQSCFYLEFLSRKLTISKIISSNIVQERVKFTQNINWTETFSNQIQYFSKYSCFSYLEYGGAHSLWRASWRKISSHTEKIQSDWPELWSYHLAAPLLWEMLCKYFWWADYTWKYDILT